MGDLYDEAIDHFNKHPCNIFQSWACPESTEYGFLFRFLTPSGFKDSSPDGSPCGCPIQVRAALLEPSLYDFKVAYTDELTKAVANSSLPTKLLGLGFNQQMSALEEIADIQRLADAVLNRKPEEYFTKGKKDGCHQDTVSNG